MFYEHVPNELKALPQWVNFGATGTNPGEREYKIPYNPNRARKAKANDPTTWVPFDDALGGTASGQYAGIGFVFNGNGFVGVDFDHCFDEYGQLDIWAAEWVERLDSYTEVSPSGNGLHVICKGALPGKAVKRGEAEMYDRARYFTVTGKAYGEPRPLRDAQEAIDALYRKLNPTESNGSRPFQSAPTGVSDYTGQGARPLPAGASLGLEKDAKFLSLWNGERPNGNESSDDMALMNKLAYWCGRDARAMRAAFLSSPHVEAKDPKHLKKLEREDYIARTVAHALQTCTRTAQGDHEAYQTRLQEGGGSTPVRLQEGDGSTPARPQEGNGSRPLQSAQALTSDTSKLDARHCVQAQPGPLAIPVVEGALESLNITVRLNLLTHELEYTGVPSRFSVGGAANTMPVFLRDVLKGFQVKGATTLAIAECLSCVADMNRYNPVEEFLQAGAWDGVDRLSELYRILGVTEPKYQTYVRKWLIQCVALSLNDEENPIGAEGALILQGPQGCGKTSFFRYITPYPAWFVEGATIDVNNKDTLIRALGGMITELGELESTLRRDQPALKAFITSAYDRIREPYARAATKSARHTSLCGTTNSMDYLQDDTGSRRFWTVPVAEMDKARIFSWASDREWVFQLWYQVYLEWQRDPRGFRLTDNEMAQLQKDNEDYSVPLPFEREIREMLNFDLPPLKWSWWKASDLAPRLSAYGRPTARAIGKALKKVVEDEETRREERRREGQGPGPTKWVRKYQGYPEYFIPLSKDF